MSAPQGLFGRKCSLQISTSSGDIMDLSEFRIIFHVEAHDYDHPGNAVIRIYNLAGDTVSQIKQEYQSVTLQAGYDNGPFSAIFIGSIMQYRIGKENAVTTYLDLLCADQDILYNATPISTSFAAGWNPQRVVAAVVKAANTLNETIPHPAGQITINSFSEDFLQSSGIRAFERGKVLYGASKDVLKSTATSLNCSWSVQKGVLQIIPFDRYLPSETVVLTQASGVIGIPEVTNEGIVIKCLLNPLIQVGGSVTLDNSLVNQIANALGNFFPPGASGGSKGLAYNAAYADDAQFIPSVGLDSKVYRVLVVEYEGDTRGHPWYVNITALLADPSTKTVIQNTVGAQ
jgi:Baseplate hub gp41